MIQATQLGRLFTQNTNNIMKSETTTACIGPENGQTCRQYQFKRDLNRSPFSSRQLPEAENGDRSSCSVSGREVGGGGVSGDKNVKDLESSWWSLEFLTFYVIWDDGFNWEIVSSLLTILQSRYSTPGCHEISFFQTFQIHCTRGMVWDHQVNITWLKSIP